MAYEFNRFNNSPFSSEMRGRFSGQNLPNWLQGMMIYNGQTTDSPTNTFRIQNGGNSVSYFANKGRSDSRGYESSRTSGMKGCYAMNNCNCYKFGNASPMGPNLFNDQFNAYGDLVDVSKFISIRTGTSLQDRSGDYYNLGASFGSGNKYYILKNDNNDFSRDARIVTSIPSRFPNHIGYFHTYGITDNHLIFCEQPWAFDVNKLRQFGSQNAYQECMSFVPGEKNYFHVVDKRSGRRLGMNFVTDMPYHFYKFVHCSENNDKILIDVLCYEGPDAFSRYRCCESGPETCTLRFEFPLNNCVGWGNNNCMTVHPLNTRREGGFNYPICQVPRFNSSKYEYNICMDGSRMTTTQGGNSLMKINHMTGEKMFWRPNCSNYSLEGVTFIPNPSRRFDDDGVLITYLSNPRNLRESFLVFIDAKNMMEISRVSFDEPISFGSYTTYKM